MWFGKWVSAGVCAMAVVFFSLTSFSADEDEQALRGVQRVRVRTMKSISRSMRRIRAYAKKGNYERVARAAEEVALLTAAIPHLSPEGSNFEKTRMKASVWSQFDDYKRIAGLSAQTARELAKAAVAEDRSGVMRAFTVLSNSCGQCHKPYRKKKEGKRK